jgi:hypothetical protein
MTDTPHDAAERPAYKELMRWLASDFFDGQVPSGYSKRVNAALAEAADSQAVRLLTDLLRVAFKDEMFLTQNGVPMEATPGVRRAVRKVRAYLAALTEQP